MYTKNQQKESPDPQDPTETDKGGMVLKRALAFLLCLLLAFTCSACGDGGYKSDMSFTYILSQDVSSLDPQTASGPASGMVIDSIFEGLCRIDEEGEAVPGAAKSWDKNNDATVFTFHLRNGAKWSNGAELTADDFLFAIQRALRPETSTPAVDDLFVIRNARAVYTGELEESSLGVRAEDDRTLVIELEKSYPDFPALTAGSHYMPCNRAYFEESSGHYGLSSDYLITNGPFTFSNIYSWKTDYGKRAISLSRSENYQGAQKVLPAELTFLIDYADTIDTDPVTALVNGDVDILTLPENTAKEAAGRGCGVEALDDAVTGLLLNPQTSSLELPAARELFIKTLDRQALLDRRQDKNSTEASGIMPDCVRWNGEPYYSDGAKVFAQQDDSATQMISSLLEMLKLEQLPSITVICPDDEESINIANGFLVSWNSKLGNAFNIEPMPDAEFQSRVAAGDYEAALYTLRAGGTSPYEVLKAFESTSSPTLLQSDEYDAALHSLTFDLPSYRDLENRIQENYVFYPLFSDRTYYVTNPNTRGITASPDMGVDFSAARKKG